MQGLKLGFVGGGNMARALIAGLLRHGTAPKDIRVGEPLAAQRAALEQDFGVATTADNAEAVQAAQLVVLAVKPQELAPIVRKLRPLLAERRPLLLSIAAGIRTSTLQDWCPGLPVVRAMPNLPARVGAGATGLYAPPGTSAADRQLAETVMAAIGHCVWVDKETAMDVVTALSGSGPAYFFLLAEQMAAAAVALGLDADTARTLAAETLHGAGALAHQDHDLARQRLAVTSKGGTTEAALQVLNTSTMAGQVTEALTAAARRGGELAEQLSRKG